MPKHITANLFQDVSNLIDDVKTNLAQSVSDFTNGQYSEEIKPVYPNTHQANRYVLSFKA
ncbi:MAG: hypothetical protein ACD_46C00434G0003 [uncultured bacterium]|nr:MAG: hypothetical protein ACD_46C00434G0003 [uncultured bacterium]